MSPEEFRDYVDKFLSAPKKLIGADQPLNWGPTRDADGRRLKLPFEIDGEVRGESLVLDAYPNRTPSSFHLMVVIEPAVCRVDYEVDAIHPNEIFGPVSGLPSQVVGPHYHSWDNNRHLFTAASRLVKLKNAVPLPKNPMAFDNVLRWFCAENNIELPGRHMIELPPRTLLL